MLLQSPEPEVHDKVTQKSRPNWNLEMLVFEERGKPEYPEKNRCGRGNQWCPVFLGNVINDNEADFSSVSPFALTF